MKRIICIFIALFVLAFSVLPAVSAAENSTDPNYIYFAVPTEGGVAWNNFSMVYCHIWSRNGGDVYGWQEKKERCEDCENGYWRYDLSEIDFDPEGEYSLIFSNEIGMQTYNLNITSSCKGDIVVCDGETVANPVDGQKRCAVARWTHNGEKVHPAIEVDSAGKTVNIDEVDPDEIETKWGSSEGKSYDLPALTAEEEKIEETQDSTVNVDVKAEKEDGINLVATTTVIIIVSAAIFIAVVIFTVVLARKNKK